MYDISKILGQIEFALNTNNFLRLTALEDLHKNEKGDPFKILIGTILSSRTRDENTTQALIKLFNKYEGVEEISQANLDDIKKEITSVGFYNIKAARIKQVANIIKSEFHGQVPNNEEELLKLPGVGRKTANCVLVYAFQKSAIPVDTHVHRICNRLGIVSTKSPEETEKELSRSIDRKHWVTLNSAFVRYGQNICLPLKPKCNYCNLRQICKYYNENKENTTKARKRKRKKV
jgi:endonuclease-3